MFGHNDKPLQDNDNLSDSAAVTGTGEPGIVSPPSAPEPPQPTDQPWQHPGTPLPNDDASDDAKADADTAPAVPPVAEPVDDTPASDIIDDTPVDHDLIDIKQKALGQLSPLVGHLDQPPDERFRTLMMMIQASDDQSLIKDAYEAAQAITDEKVKAQALLDIVNEINYFSQNK